MNRQQKYALFIAWEEAYHKKVVALDLNIRQGQDAYTYHVARWDLIDMLDQIPNEGEEKR